MAILLDHMISVQALAALKAANRVFYRLVLPTAAFGLLGFCFRLPKRNERSAPAHN